MTESAVKLYILNVSAFEDRDKFDLAYSLIPKSRKEKIDTINQEDKKRQSLGAALLLIKALSEFEKLAPGFHVANYNFNEVANYSFNENYPFAKESQRASFSDLKIAFNENGKPYLPDYPDFHFSISHSREYSILAVSKEPIGCDIERIREIKPALRGHLSSEEFIRIWTLKESHEKLLGTGLKAPFKDLGNYAPTKDTTFTEIPIPGYQCYVATNK